MYRIVKEQCTGCGRCFDICPRQAILLVDKVAQIDDERCDGCGRCLQVCRSQAIVESTHALEKFSTNEYPIAKVPLPRPAMVQSSTRYPLLVGALDLVAGITKILIDHDNQSMPARSSPHSASLHKTSPAASQRRKRRRQGRFGG